MPKPRYTRQFKKNIKKIQASGDKDMEKLKTVVRKLVDATTLESRYHDHSLAGNLKGHRHCHIEPDWILLYRIDKERQETTFVRTGSHSDLFVCQYLVLKKLRLMRSFKRVCQ
ncbi:MAG TPA: type II toxin-antitoxin system YafQ family toxin [Thermodesulfovibrionales bacterium]|nr:type II toxin-antitoxin system YafQ family toxin [Thermodesulfovibrionales bacterium]